MFADLRLRAAQVRRQRSPAMLEIRLTRLSPTRHRFECLRPDGSRERAELETKSLLVHDLVHLALESEAGLTQSFFGLLASGRSLSDLSPDGAAFPNAEAALSERIAGPLTGVCLGRIGPAQFIDAFAALEAAHGEQMPPWLDQAFVERVAARFRRLHGAWKATPFGCTLVLSFDPRGDHEPVIEANCS